MNWLWTTSDLMAAMQGRPVGALPEGITGIAIDSRAITKGDAFFAIKGDRVDGHNFASMAMANGAALLVVSEGKLPALGKLTAPMIVVDDVLHAMERLGCAARDRSAAKIIAVTGSVGKTTTKELLRTALKPLGRVHASVASFNNHWGVPLTLARMPENTEFGIFEIGMNHPGEIRPLTRMVRPHVAIVTNIAPAHIGNFSGIEEIAAAKAEIFEGLVDGGHAIINRDNEMYETLDKAAQEEGVTHIHTFGTNPKADFRMAEFAGSAESSVLWAALGNRTLEVTLGAPGRHVAENALAVLGAVSVLHGNIDQAVHALADFSAGSGRGKRRRLLIGAGSFTLIDESYNANPSSMRAALSLLGGAVPTGDGRRVAVLGDMRELGHQSAALHTDLVQPIADSQADVLFLGGIDIGGLPDHLPETLDVHYRETAQELAPLVVETVRAGDVVMIKASLSVGFGQIVAALLDKYPPFADTKPVLE
ncbi:UDP-N-acetylmuramoylalanyl-D-glutamyl-2,6-diaminopimelate--D-alanyl-D-alanine ligase [Rhizobium sp. CFBP 8762]|uniref:UDP-N-acetylmuramoylalanyl-D-glutamyl-2, 6-diaminopimelate--D-alanyl-D-alanine ligase n=1 Tax=Rhizobium sp. CFBP 8762 TaxID=2775279 RepID=UPI0017845DCC|nr:UDP-N-acetylmuramoylalanyl-D-glutamyl-2,6-diaminopimelate--D-alanyl-D-alanine ligase [Rhizobium sp. CFBP 8762]MBD8554824.1 UDP-N-acetylmuramoylalanyl-D-glutamyl-2,6-diaminopimelate--D-alanyl-D-alanine ligase [Rhizobium sp. CFBP 8762]